MTPTRRRFLGGAITTAASAMAVDRAALAALPEPVVQSGAATLPPLEADTASS